MKDLTNQRFGSLTVISIYEKTPKHVKWSCQCDCGNITVVYQQHLGKKTNTCGKHNNKKSPEHHNQSNSREYSSYMNMKDRCQNPNNPDYENYGGRGITISPDWNNSFAQFLKDMGPRPENTTLDRIRTNGNYEPNNCRWANIHIQNQNKRSSKLKLLQQAFAPPTNKDLGK